MESNAAIACETCAPAGAAPLAEAIPAAGQDAFQELDQKNFLKALLQDRSTKKGIIWATDTYSSLGCGFGAKDEIDAALIAGRHECLKNMRTASRLVRTRKHGEVFTPLSVCRMMCDYACEALDNGDWQKFINARILEITCGEAPFLAARHDPETGAAIPVGERSGLLDRKLRLIGEKAQDKAEWLEWTFRAYQSVYGYEFQGDNLLLARMSLFATFGEYMQERWNCCPAEDECRRILNIITWNVWQMNGLTGTIPFRTAAKPSHGSLFDTPQTASGHRPCLVRNWDDGTAVTYLSCGKQTMKFDFIIGNPPYQEEMAGTSDNPVYNEFMDAAYELADKVELISPARFLFNAGKTPKDWNRKMLDDPHLKVLRYWSLSEEVFQGPDIKGGIVITYRDKIKNNAPIKDFVPNDKLYSALKKIKKDNFTPFSSIIYAPESYRLSRRLHEYMPEAKNQLSNGHLYDLTTNIFYRLPEVFFDNVPDDRNEYIGIAGRENNARIIKYIRKDYVEKHGNLDSFKIFMAKANGTGQLGQELSQMIIGKPGVGHNQTFISIGSFETEAEALNCQKYIKTRFTRAMLGTLKVTQDNKKSVWKNVPLQDFTPASDIDWSKSIAEIDRQLYAKYGLDDEEIEFIESHVREME